MTALGRRGASAAGWVVLGMVAVLPLLTIALQAASTRWFFPDLVPREWTLDALRRVGANPETRSALIESLVVSFSAAAVSVTLAVPAARALALGRLRYARVVAIGFLVPTVIPPVALAMGLNVALLRLDIAGSRAVVVMAHLAATLPYAALVLTAALTRYDVAFERQAALLGAGPGRILARVFLPLALPAILVAAALAFVVSWSQYLLTLLPGGGRVITFPVLLLAASNGGSPAGAAALAVAGAIPPAIAVLVVIRHLDALGAAR